MKTSIFTPTHNPKYLKQLYDSIKEQPFDEWVIVANGCTVPDFKDERIKVFNLPKLGEHYVGALKRYACEKATGDILIEVDHDDLLTSDAIEEIKKAFTKDIGFVYSNSANFKGDMQKTDRYNESHGWKYRDYKDLEEHIAFPPHPANVSKIWYCPNHVRAWTKDAYWKAGGHSQDMRVLDDQDLIARTYLVTKFKHIDKCLYLYRIDGNNTWLKYNKEIQDNVYRLYDDYIERLSRKWAEDNGLLALDLGGRFNSGNGFKTVDLKDADIIMDLNKKWELDDNSVGVLRAHDLMEHLPDKLHFIQEAYRVLAPGGILLSKTPSTDSRGAWQDPTHCAFYNANSFLYYTNQNWAKYIDTPVRFQEMRLYTTTPNAQQVSWVVAHLVSLKDNFRPAGVINI